MRKTESQKLRERAIWILMSRITESVKNYVKSSKRKFYPKEIFRVNADKITIGISAVIVWWNFQLRLLLGMEDIRLTNEKRSSLVNTINWALSTYFHRYLHWYLIPYRKNELRLYCYIYSTTKLMIRRRFIVKFIIAFETYLTQLLLLVFAIIIIIIFCGPYWSRINRSWQNPIIGVLLTDVINLENYAGKHITRNVGGIHVR